MSDKKLSFRKKERLCGEIAITNLFTEGDAFIAYPYRIVYKKIRSEKAKAPAQVVIGAPKKRFKHAVKRNLLKRRMREAYRLHKAELVSFLEMNNLHIHFSINYISNEIIEFNELEQKMQKVIKLLKEKLV